MKLAWQNNWDGATLTTGSEIATLPGTNVQKPHLSRKWHTAAAVKSSHQIADMGADGTRWSNSMFALLGSNLTAAATYRLRASATDPLGVANCLVDTGVVAAGVKTGYGAIYKAVKLAYLDLPGEAGDYASTPDTAANSVVGDLDVRVKVAAADWTPAGIQTLMAKRGGAGQRSWQFRISGGSTGNLVLVWSADGTNELSATSSVATGFTDGHVKWVRATIDVDNGAAGRTVTFYTSDDYDPLTNTGTWTQLGTQQTSAGVTSIFNSNAVVEVGSSGAGTAEFLVGDVFYAEMRNGINGAIAASFDPRRGTNAALSLVSLQGETWTINQNGNPKATLVVAETHSARYWRIDPADATVADNLQIGRVFLGPSWSHQQALQWGWGVTAVDESPVEESYGGQSFPDARAKRRQLDFSIDYLTEAEIYDNAFAMARANGVVSDVLAIPFENGAYISEQAVWGLCQAHKPIIHRLTNTFRTSFTVRERL